MKKFYCFVYMLMLSAGLYAQQVAPDTAVLAKVTVTKDPRLDILAKAEAEINNRINRYAKGYRLFVLKSNDRDYAMKVRTYLLQNFPEEKVIMTFESPFIKMKFGDFVDMDEAERYRDMIIRGKVVTGNIYVVPDMIELKPDKIKEPELK